MFQDIELTRSIKAGSKIEVFGHADHVANSVKSGVVVRKTKTGRVVIRLDHNRHEYKFAKCGRGLGVNPFSICGKYLDLPA